jgi:hypothetical protein
VHINPGRSEETANGDWVSPYIYHWASANPTKENLTAAKNNDGIECAKTSVAWRMARL